MVSLLAKHLDFDLLGSVLPTRLEPLVWGENGAQAEVEQAGPLLRAELVVTDPKGRRTSSLPVVFTSRVRAPDVRSILGADPSGCLHVALELGVPSTTVRLQFRFEPLLGATPLDLRPILGWFDSLQPGCLLGLWMADKGRWGVSPEPIPDEPPRFPDGYATAVRALARIQERSGTVFPMPNDIDRELANSVEVADKLIRGETASGHWRDASINDDPQLRQYLESSEHGVLLEFKTGFVLDIAGTPVLVGDVEYRFMQVTLVGRDVDAGALRLAPGRDTGFEVRLVSVPDRMNPDGSTSWIPPAMVEPYEGQWVAQSGTTILFAGASFEMVAASVRASGQLATVWRVPGSREEAEMLHAIES